MKFIKFTIIYLLFTVSYITYILSKLEVDHLHALNLTFNAIISILLVGTNLLNLVEKSDEDGGVEDLDN